MATHKRFSSIFRNLRRDNIFRMFFRTSLALIFTELAGVTALFFDGIIASRYVGIDAYSGISLLGPFTSILLVITGFLSTGCMVLCPRFVGKGKKAEANEILNLAALSGVLIALILVISCIFAPDIVMTACGINVGKYPELYPHMLGYLRGFMTGIPFYVLIQVTGPIIVMDNGKRLFTISSVVLCAAVIIGDLLAALVFKGGAFGMGLATTFSYVIQFAILAFHFAKKDSHFKLAFKYFRFTYIRELISNGTPALIKRISGSLRDILVNYINIMVSLTAAAIASSVTV